MKRAWEEALPWLSMEDYLATPAETAQLKEFFRTHPGQLDLRDAKHHNLPLHYAIIRHGEQGPAIVAALLEMCVNAVTVETPAGLALHVAALSQNGKHGVTIVKLLLAASAEGVKTRRGSDGGLPLHLAARYQSGKHGLTIVTLLLGAYAGGANLIDQNGNLALHLAARHQSGEYGPAIVKLLLAVYAHSAKATNELGDLPLHLAARYQSSKHAAELAGLLITVYPKGAQQCNKAGLTPIDIIQRNSALLPACKEVLLELAAQKLEQPAGTLLRGLNESGG